MKIGIDVDGVLAQFVPAMNSVLINITGKNLFPQGVDTDAPMWNWPQYFGYTNEETKAAFKAVADSKIFWATLKPYDDAIYALAKFNLWQWYNTHDLYFITNRGGSNAKTQTERWLKGHGMELPTVLITGDKDIAARALGLDIYLDDYHVNANQVAKNAFPTQSILLNRPWNTAESQFSVVKRVSNLREFIDLVENYGVNGNT